MKKISIISLAFLLFVTQAFAQTKLALVRPANSDSWGFVNEKGEMVIPAIYAMGKSFSPDGLAAGCRGP